MATLEDTLINAIANLANKAANAGAGSSAVEYAAAANQLAEARAWVNNASQPHGGFSYSKQGKS